MKKSFHYLFVPFPAVLETCFKKSFADPCCALKYYPAIEACDRVSYETWTYGSPKKIGSQPAMISSLLRKLLIIVAAIMRLARPAGLTRSRT